MTNQVIPEAAVEAAWDKLHENPVRPIGIDWAELTAALEAAAPHMLAGNADGVLSAGEIEAVAVMIRSAKAAGWDEGYEAGTDHDPTGNPYRTTK